MSKMNKGLRGIHGLGVGEFKGDAPNGTHAWPELRRPAVVVYRGGAAPKRICQTGGEFTAKVGPASGKPCVGHGLGYSVPGLTDADGIVQLPKGEPVALPPRLAIELAIDISSSPGAWPVGPASVINPVTGKALTGRQVIDVYVHPDDLGTMPDYENGIAPTGLYKYLSEKAGWGGPLPDAKWRRALEVLTIKSTVDGSVIHTPTNPDGYEGTEAEIQNLRETVAKLQAQLDDGLNQQAQIDELRALVSQLSQARGAAQLHNPEADDVGAVVVTAQPDGALAAEPVNAGAGKAKSAK